MTTLQEQMNEAWESASSDRMKMGSLVNLTFVILSAREFTRTDGTTTIVGTILLDGEQHEAWLDGSKIRPQLDVLAVANAFPVEVKLVQEAVGQGKAYKFLVTNENPTVPEASEPTDVNSGNGTFVSPGPVGTTVSIGTQTPQERAQELFMAALVAKGDDVILELVAASGASDAVMFNGEGKLVLDASKLTLPQSVKLIAALS